jgi:hypothetical protein
VVQATIETWADASDPAFVGLLAEGRTTEISENIAYLECSIDDWEPVLLG